MGFQWTPELDAYLQAAADQGASPYAISVLETVSAGVEQAFALLRAESGMPAFGLTPNVDAITANARAQLEAAFITWTPELESFITRAGEAGQVLALHDAVAQAAATDPTTLLKQVGRTSGIGDPPPLCVDVEGALSAQYPVLEQNHVKVTEELKQFIRAVASRGTTSSTIGDALAAIPTAGAQAAFAALARRSSLPAPNVLLDVA